MQFPFEVYNYWLQHFLIFFVVPPFLVYTWGKSTMPHMQHAWECFVFKNDIVFLDHMIKISGCLHAFL